MTDLNSIPDTGGPTDAAEGRTANLVYILFLVSLIVGITSLIGVVMAYIYRDGAPEWVKSPTRSRSAPSGSACSSA